jgi:AcrR family transcriptional regulator
MDKALELTNTQKKIIDAAIKVFSEKGFEGATTSEIAQEAGVAEGTIFRHFSTKKGILQGILLQVVDNYRLDILGTSS